MLTSETIHASCVARNGKAILIAGPSGSGKSDLALRLIDRGSQLVSDDYTIVHQSGSDLLARAPETIKGRMEVRGIGIVDMPTVQDVPVTLIIDLTEPADRFPTEGRTRLIAGKSLPVAGLSPFEASAPLKAEMAHDRAGGL